MTIPKTAASLLASALACNLVCVIGVRADAPATRPAAPSAAREFHVDGKKTLEFLAADNEEGRGVGTAGLDRAADQIADDFRKLGLQPAPGLEGYFQPFKMTTSVKLDPSTSLGDGKKEYKLGADFTALPLGGEGAFKGDVVFVGYGISSKQFNYDDYAGIDVKGKVVLALRFEPHNPAGTSRFVKDDWSPEAHLETKLRTAAEHGAAALVLVNPPAYHPGDILVPFSHAGAETSTIPFLQVRQEVADAWLKQAGAGNLASLQSAIDKEGKPASMPLENVKVKGAVAIRREEKQVKNVVAMRPGTRADQYLIVGAHYDHLGFGGPGSLAPGVRAIHHGADDNASGTVAMLELADHFAHAPASEKNLIFIAFTGEEEGLVGSSYFVKHCPIDLNKVIAMVNLDMVGRVRNNVLYIGGQGTAPSFDAFVKEAEVDSALVLKSIGRGGLGPSDHMSFAVKKIPVLFLFSGMHLDYHRPSDTADKINYQGIEQTVNFATRLINGLNAMPREKYVDAADKDSMMGFGHLGATGADTGRPRVSLGVIPDYSEMESAAKGVKISGTMAGSGAAKAGLLGGDVLVQWNATKLDSLQQLQNLIDAGKPGETIKIGVIRDGKRIDVDATLTERK